MKFRNFSELYLTGCKLRQEQPTQIRYFLDLDKIYEKVKENQILIESFIKQRQIVHYSSFEFPHKLPPDFSNLILVYHNIDKIIELIEDMEDNHDIHLNKWKLDRIEKVLLLGWNKYCEIHIDFCL